MKTLTQEWLNTYRRLLGNGWVTNEMEIMKTLAKQQKKLPISVEQARQQVMRLKQLSLSTVKKGQSTIHP